MRRNKSRFDWLKAHDPEKLAALVRQGAKALKAKGNGHRFTSDSARAAGRKGGLALSVSHLQAIGRKGGLVTALKTRKPGGRWSRRVTSEQALADE